MKKTRLCCYGTRDNQENLKITCKLNDSQLPLSKQYTYLGVILDETLNLESNFNAIFKKFSYRLFQFSKIRKYLPVTTPVLVYKQTVLPLVEYVCYLMYLNRKHDIDKLQKLQNRALRLCYKINDPRLISVPDLHQQAHLLTLDQRREKQLLLLMYVVSRKVEFVKPIRATPDRRIKLYWIVRYFDAVYMDTLCMSLDVVCGISWIPAFRNQNINFHIRLKSKHYIAPLPPPPPPKKEKSYKFAFRSILKYKTLVSDLICK